MKKYPVILKTTKSTSGLRLTLEIPQDLSWFDGHFESLRILPGMVSVLWVEEYIRIYCAPNVSIRSVDNVRFSHPIFPGTRVDLDITVDQENRSASFRYCDPEKQELWVYSSGTLRI